MKRTIVLLNLLLVSSVYADEIKFGFKNPSSGA